MPYVPVMPTGSPTGKLIKITATASPGTPLHTTNATAGVITEVMIEATNTGTDFVLLYIGWGGEVADDDVIPVPVPPQDAFTLSIGRGSRLGPSLAITAWASITDVVKCKVTVDEYTVPA